MLLGALYLAAFAGGASGLYGLRESALTASGLAERVRRIRAGMWTMAALSWLTVLTGTFVVYPWYRAPAPDSPRSRLLADAGTSGWHNFGMEWKEHVAWIAPILATAVAAVATRYGAELSRHRGLRSVALWLFFLAFCAAAVAGVLGALVSKVAPVA